VTRLEVWLSGVGLYETAPLEALKEELASRLPGLAVETWLEANPAYAAVLPLYDLVMAIYVGFFFLLGGLILLNALYLSLVERVREFGLLHALGLTGGGWWAWCSGRASSWWGRRPWWVWAWVFLSTWRWRTAFACPCRTGF
jgi:hypothetical protein